MKIIAVQTIALLFLILGFSKEMSGQYVTIPDANFRAYLQQEYPACFNGQAQMNTNCAAIVNETELGVDYNQIYNLDGVQYFDNLTILSCAGNYLTNIPSFPPLLEVLDCQDNNLTSLPPLPNSLWTIQCGENPLISLPALPQSLIMLFCYRNYDLTTLPTLPSSLNTLTCIEGGLLSLPPLPPNLEVLRCESNFISNMPALPLSLTELNCSINELVSLPALPPSLTSLRCRENYLTSIPQLSQSLTYLDCSSNSIGSIPAPIPPSLVTFWCAYNQIASIPALSQSVRDFRTQNNLPLTSLPTLSSSLLSLDCSNTGVTSLPAVLPSTLRILYCNNLHLSFMPALPTPMEELQCENNSLTNLPTLTPALRHLYCTNNQLTSLPTLPQALNYLKCAGNDLTSLPTLPPNLYELWCERNNLTSLPALPLTLNKLYCNNNLLNALPSLPQSIRRCDARFNHLLCIPLLPSQLQYIYVLGNPVNCIPNVPPACLTCNNIPQCNPGQICAGNLAYCAGNIYIDWNLDGVMNNGEGNYINRVVSGTPGNHASATSINGYRIALNTNTTSTLSFVNPYPNALNCVPATQTVVSAGPVAVPGTFNFALQPIPNVNDLQVFMTAGLARPGFNTYVNIAVTNAGTVADAPLVSFDFPATWTVLSTSPQGTLNGNTITWQDAGLAPFNRHNFHVWFNVPANAQFGTPFTLTASVPIGTDVVPADNTFSITDFLVGAYDPNDKACNTPYLLPDYDPEQEIVFTVRFQNTGNYAADNVVVLDTLSTLLRANTLRMVSSSHTCYLDYADYSRVISFNFPNINLIDSLHNEPLSHGFVQFAAKPVANLPVGSLIQNSGNIYFDYNAPIHTNTATAEVVDCILPINDWHLYRRD